VKGQYGDVYVRGVRPLKEETIVDVRVIYLESKPCASFESFDSLESFSITKRRITKNTSVNVMPTGCILHNSLWVFDGLFLLLCSIISAVPVLDARHLAAAFLPNLPAASLLTYVAIGCKTNENRMGSQASGNRMDSEEKGPAEKRYRKGIEWSVDLYLNAFEHGDDADDELAVRDTRTVLSCARVMPTERRRR
jgi:hypothetical protein